MTVIKEKNTCQEATQMMQEKLAKAVEEKEMYISELIKAKTAQAEILDEANRISQNASMKIQMTEIKSKMLEEQ